MTDVLTVGGRADLVVVRKDLLQVITVAQQGPPGGDVLLSDADPIFIQKRTASPGVGVSAAREDHEHDIETAAAVDIGASNDEGTGSALARATHVHRLPFATLATVLAAATANIAINSRRLTSVADPVSAQDAATSAFVGASSAQVTYQPGGTAAPGVYTTVATLAAAALRIKGPKTVFIDPTFATGDGNAHLDPTGMPAGGWDFGPNTSFRGDPILWLVGRGLVVDPGAKLKPYSAFQFFDLYVRNDSSAPVISSTSDVTIIGRNLIVDGCPLAAFAETTGGTAVLTEEFYKGGGVIEGAVPAFRSDVLIIAFADEATIAPNTQFCAGGPGSIAILSTATGDISATQSPTASITLLSSAALTAYAGSNVAAVLDARLPTADEKANIAAGLQNNHQLLIDYIDVFSALVAVLAIGYSAGGAGAAVVNIGMPTSHGVGNALTDANINGARRRTWQRGQSLNGFAMADVIEERDAIQVTSATPSIIYTVDVEDGACYHVVGDVIARRTDVAQMAIFKIDASFRRVGNLLVPIDGGAPTPGSANEGAAVLTQFPTLARLHFYAACGGGGGENWIFQPVLKVTKNF